MKHYFLLLMCILTTLSAAAQTRSVKGTVTDELGEPIIGASVRVEGTNRGIVTDTNGQFVLEVSPKEKITVSFIGYKDAVGTPSNDMRIVLEEDPERHLDEVVVVGYGTQKKATLTGAVSMVNSDEIVSTKSQNVQNMLTGKISGVRVVQKTSEPGEFNNQFDIRGFGSPLIVIDGVPRSDFERMDPNEIESISVLKDASAAIYGVRAANGVVLITTKKGHDGAPRIEYNTYFGLQTPSEILRPVGSADRMTLANEVSMRELVVPSHKYSADLIQQYADGTLPTTDWYDAAMKGSAPQWYHNASVSGSSKRVNYYISFGYQDQGGFFKTEAQDYYRFNLRSNIDVQVTNNLKFSLKLAGMKDRRYHNSAATWTIFKNIWRSVPDESVYANNTAPYYQHPQSADDNPIALLDTDATGWQKNKVKTLNSTFEMEYAVPHVKGLTLNALFSYDTRDISDETWNKAYNYYYYVEASDSYSESSTHGPNYLYEYRGESYTTMWQASIKYDNTFGKHHLSALALFESSHSEGDNIYAQRNFSLSVPYLFAGDGDSNQIGSADPNGIYENANQGFVGRLNYDFGSKYLFEFAFRYDGSSKFAKGHQWGFFPSVSGGWRISEENFIKKNPRLSFIDNIKIRASYGKMGDDAASSYQFVSGYDYPNTSGGSYSNYPTGYVFGGSYTNALGFRSVANENITWYTVKTANIGIDIDLWKGLFGLTFELFQRDRTGLLADRLSTVPGTFGSTMPQENLNSDRTKGLELELRHKNHIKDFYYEVKAQVSLTRGMTRYYESTPAGNSYEYWRNYTLNRYNDIWFGYGAAGRYESWDEIHNSIYSGANYPGDYIYEDWNNDGTIDTGDMHPIATTTNPGSDFQDKRNYPLLNYGLSLSAQWKGFDLSMLWQGAGMSYISYGEQLQAPLMWDGNALEMFMDRWRPADPNANPNDPSTEWISGYYAYGGQKGSADVNSEFMIQKGDYIRLKSLEIGYTVPGRLLSFLGVKNLRFYFNAYNLLTITGVKGVDPEHPTDLYGYMYPLNKTFNFGANISF